MVPPWIGGKVNQSKEGITTWEIFVERLHTRYRPMSIMARTRLMSLKQAKTIILLSKG